MTARHSALLEPPELAEIPPDAFIRLQVILEIVRAAIWSGALAGEKPVSVMLIADQESAKTQALKYFENTTTLRYLADVTSKGIYCFHSDIELGRITHFVILDLIRVISHGRTVSDRTIQVLAGLMEEGGTTSADAGGVESWKCDAYCGVLMAITPPFFRSKRGRWRDNGFLTRFVPVFYDYSISTVSEIHHRIATNHTLPKSTALPIPESKLHIDISPELSAIIQTVAESVAQRSALKGFRLHRQLRSLIKAEAAMHGRTSASVEDCQRVFEWTKFFRSDEPVRL